MQQADAIDKEPPGAQFGRRLEQQAVGRTEFLIEHLRTGEDDLQLLSAPAVPAGPNRAWLRHE
jgi:hypothetical protein